MEGKFDTNVIKLEKTILNLSKNCYQFKNKNHKTMINMVEKIKSFSNEIKDLTKDISNIPKSKINETPKRTLKKTYTSISNTNLSNTLNSGIYHYDFSNKNPIILKENISDNNKENNLVLNSNKNLNNKKLSILPNIIYDYNSKDSKIKQYNNTDNNHCKSLKKKRFSFNYDYFNSFNGNKKKENNDSDIKQRTYSSNNLKINKIFRKDLFNDFSNDDLIYSKTDKDKNKYNMKYFKKMYNNNYNDKDITKTIILNKQNLSDNLSVYSKVFKNIKNIRREQCNINISDFYKRKNNKKMNNIERNIININKIKNFNNIKNQNNSINYNSRNYNLLNSSDNTNINTNKEKDYKSRVSSSFNPNNKNLNENEKTMSEVKKDMCNTGNSFKDKKSISNSLALNYNINALNKKQYESDKNNDYYYINNYNYYQSFRAHFKKSINTNNDDIKRNIDSNYNINKQRNLIRRKNNYKKELIDIITNDNNDINKYNNKSNYNSNIMNKEDNSKNIIFIKEEEYNSLLSKLKCKNFNECLNKIDNLIYYEDFIIKLNSLYNIINDFNKYKEEINNNLNRIFSWIESIIDENKKYKENLKKYQSFCGRLSEEFKGDEFDKFKNFIVKTLYKNKNNQRLESCNNKILSNSNCINNEKINKLNNNKYKSMNLHFYNSDDDNSTFRNRVHSYNDISFNNLKNEDEKYYATNTTFIKSYRKKKKYYK